MSRTNNYDQFLDRMELDVQRLDADYRNYIQFWELMGDYLDEFNEAPGTFTTFINSLRTSTVVLAHRLFDDKSVGIRKLIAVAENHLADIDWQGDPPQKANLKGQRDRIAGSQSVLDRIKDQRHKTYAHLDKKQILNREVFAANHPLDSNDIGQAIELAKEIVHDHHLWRKGSDLSMEIANAVNVKHLFELIRIGRKYRRQEITGSFR